MRLFVAISVGDEVRAAASRVRAAIESSLQPLKTEPPRLVWVAPRALHVTLRFLGEQPDERVTGLVAAVQQPYALAPFSIRWHGLGAFPSPRRPRAIWMGVRSGARELGQLEVEIARRFGGLLAGEEPAHAEPFHPHLTLARVKTESKAVRWPEVLEAAAVGEVSSHVGHVLLYRSRGLPGGEGYEEIGRGRLGG
jgi:RNA 2',3'-cyclic 3'-phosphodiesterase